MQARSKALTAIGNFSCSRGLSVSLLLLVTLLAGCDTLRTRGEVDESRRESHRGTPAAAPVTSTQTAVEQPAAPPPSAPPTPMQPPNAAPPTFLNKELPKVGIILGPGGLKTYAEIGVLREFAKARIPVHAVAGLEWGAIIGGLYAMQGQVNDLEWKAFKLREEDVPLENGFFSSTSPLSIGSLGTFLDTVFGTTDIEKGHIDFACPAYWSRVDRFGWMTKGRLSEAMRACVPYPPLYAANDGVTASPFSVEEAAQHLRSRGANLIVLVNVLAPGEALPTKAAARQPSDQLLWSEIRREMLRAKSPYVHYTINVNTNGHPITDLNGRRALMESGSRAAADVVSKMAAQYGF